MYLEFFVFIKYVCIIKYKNWDNNFHINLKDSIDFDISNNRQMNNFHNEKTGTKTYFHINFSKSVKQNNFQTFNLK